jgi:hypothetical protein
MAALTIQCVNPPPYRAPKEITIPNLGVLEAAQAAISSIPDPADVAAQLMDKINLAMLPLRKYLQMVEGVVAIKQCIEAIPRAIIRVSPTPIYDCLKALVRALAPIIADIPPIPYIRAFLDIAEYMVDLIDSILELMQELDNRIDRLLDLRAFAQGIGDIDLINFSNCGLKDVTLSMQQILDLLRYIQPVVNILLAVILRLLPTPAAQKASDELIAAAAAFPEAQNALADVDITVTGLPPLSGMLEAMARTRNAMVAVHNAVAPIIGAPANLEDAPIPTFIHF